MRLTQKQIERQQIEMVFRLDGGELENKPWSARRYWYHGSPSYSEQNFGDVEIRTSIENRLYGQDKAPRGWVEVATYHDSGESECLACKSEDDGCRFCDGSGFVYLGDGWCEVVYVRKTK